MKKSVLKIVSLSSPRGEVAGGGGGGMMNWEIGVDIYTLICIK